MAQSIRDLAREVVASPLGDVIAAVGQGVAAAQRALDDASLAQTLEIYAEGGEEAHRLLREIGYRPTFYALPETTGEVRVSLTLGSNCTAPQAAPSGTAVGVQLSRIGRTIGVAPNIYATPVDAGFASRYGFQASISAKLSFKIVPVPAPNGADELRVVPGVTGRVASAAIDALEGIGLTYRMKDSHGAELATSLPEAKVADQYPAHGTILRTGNVVTLTLVME